MGPKRLFVALWPTPTVRGALSHLVRRELQGLPGRRVAAYNWHLTLAFIGQVEATAEARLRAKLIDLVAPGFALRLDQLGYWARPRVVWLAPQRWPAAAADLQHQVTRAVAAAGVALDPRPFVPHLTLLRKVPSAVLPARVQPVVWPVQELVLVHSVTHPEGVRYTPLLRLPLAPAEG